MNSKSFRSKRQQLYSSWAVHQQFIFDFVFHELNVYYKSRNLECVVNGRKLKSKNAEEKN